ncbi:hypothetical protein OF83DRAFT_1198753 [Amylostereum chailletii]|nr:hypothetical protein OF83DRAFT_1198753 [Amylostereum chailletii]
MVDAPISIAVGIFVGLLASCVQSLGLTIQRKSHVLNGALPEDLQRSEHRRPLWILGFAIFLSSNILGSLFQIASLPVVILAPLGAVSLLWNAFFARLLLGDASSLWVVLGTLLIAGGAVLIAVFGIVPEPTHSLEDLLRLFRRPAFVAYFSLLGFVVVVCLVITHVAEFSYLRRLRRLPTSPPLSPLLIPTDSSTDLTTEHTPLLDRKPPSSSATSISSARRAFLVHIRPSRVPLLLALSYASVSAILSGMCLLFAKSGVELLLLTIGGDNQFWRWQAWMLLLGLAAFALLQLWYFHKALKLADPTIVCPLAFCFYNLSSIINGLVYFDQFSLIAPLHLCLVALGIVILLGGVWAVSFQAVDVGMWNGEGDEESVLDEEIIVEPIAPLILESTPPRSSTPPSDEDTFGSPSTHRGRVMEREASPETPNLSMILGSSSQQGTLSPQDRHRARRRHTLISDHSSPPPTPGFSIGLSPVSPGFSLVPRERRRRVSGNGGWRESVRSPRRAVSEGNVLPPRDEEDGPASPTQGGEESRPLVAGKAKGRWRWLRSLVTSRS